MVGQGKGVGGQAAASMLLGIDTFVFCLVLIMQRVFEFYFRLVVSIHEF